jgi:type I restriction enzyme S subunit
VLPARVNQHVAIVRLDRSAAVPGFVQGYLVSPVGKQRLLALAQGGATREALTKATIEGFSIPLPALSVQERIAEILGAIDTLIENGRRRIALLERIAQSTYREWFVRFRYPGHEDDGLVDSPLGLIPAGWSAARLGDVIELRYGKALTASSRKGGPVAVVGSSGVVGWHDEKLVSGPAVVVGRKGNVGSVSWIQGDCWPIDTTYYVTTDLPLHFVYRMLGEIEFIDSHAAVPGLSRDQAYTIDILRPGMEVAALFEDMTSELSAMSSVLESQAAVLSRIRDALLPKLVTGAIDVSTLDLDALLEEPVA